MTDALERVIRPIVEGQIDSFFNDHPDAIPTEYRGYKGYPAKSARKSLRDSLSKRIVRDLLCAQTRARLVAAALEVSTEANASGAQRGT